MFKWRSFGAAVYRREMLRYLRLVVSATALALLLAFYPQRPLASYRWGLVDALRLCLEGFVVWGAHRECWALVRDEGGCGSLARCARGTPGPFVTLLSVDLVVMARVLGLGCLAQVRLLSVCVLGLWLRMLDVAKLSHRSVGPFFIMVLDMAWQVHPLVRGRECLFAV